MSIYRYANAMACITADVGSTGPLRQQFSSMDATITLICIVTLIVCIYPFYYILSLIVVALMLAAAFTACNQTPTPASTVVSTVATEAPTVAPTATPLQITKMSLFINATWYWTDKWEGIIPDAITAKTGVTFDVTRAADNKRIGLIIASQDLPDMMKRTCIEVFPNLFRSRQARRHIVV